MAFLRDEEKQIILESYFNIEWCDDVSDLRCVHCHRVAISHFMSNCQHIFCNNCCQIYGDKERRLNCPQCQEQITQLDNQDVDVEVKINRLKIFCPNKKYGCNYTDQLKKLPSHLMTCINSRKPALPVEAPVTNNMADVVNELTKLNATMTEVKNKVDQLEKMSEDIESKINATINDNKKNEGLRVNMQLAFQNYTEEFQSMRSQVESVNRNIELSEWFQQQMMGFEMDQMKAKMDLMAQQNKMLQTKKAEWNRLKAETYEWTIKDVSRNIHDRSSYKSKVFKLTGCKYDIKAKIFVDDDEDTFISLQFKDGNKINQFLYNDVFNAVTYIIRDQSDRPKKQDISCKVYLRFGEGGGTSKWVLLSTLCTSYVGILSPPYVKDDCMKITVLFERPSIDRNFISNNGVLLCRLDNYAQRKEETNLNEIWSPIFYTSPQGYRVGIKLSVHLPKSVSLQVHFLTGAHDATLPPIFVHTTTATLINQIDPSQNMVRSMCNEADNVGDEIFDIDFRTITPIESSGFIHDDSLLIEVTIEPGIMD